MGIETRKGRLYYYKKRREGDRVVSEYVGGGELVHLAEYEAQKKQFRKDAERELFRRAQMSASEIDRYLDEMDGLIDGLVIGSLYAMGFHQHKGQWRRKRHGGKTGHN
jgi:hypothetical protein